MKKIDQTEKSKELCDVCGKKVPTYSNNKYYYLCEQCFSDNPHKNHKLVKIKDNNNLMNDNEIIDSE
jgi:predicted amidophosphoribosyltransferase